MQKIQYLAAILLLTSCAIAGQLKNSEVKNSQYDIVNNNVEFVATKTSYGNGLTIGEVLALEKKNYGDNISIVNIIEQNKQLKIFGIFIVGIEKVYVYDVIKYKKEIKK